MAEHPYRPLALSAALLFSGAVLAAALAARGLAPSRWLEAWTCSAPSDMAEVVFVNAVLPRAAAALASGAALGLGAALFGLALRNPLAVPDTLGVAGGAQLALAAATLWAPSTLAIAGRGAIAFGGGCLAVAVVLGITRRDGLRPALILPAGLAVSFYASAMATLLLLFHAHDLSGVSAWSGGSLAVQDWSPVYGTVMVLGATALPVVVLRRALGLLDFDEATGRALGVPIAAYRLLALALGVTLTAAVTGTFGPLGFVGIGASLLARASGARRPGSRLAWSATLGAGLLWLADGAVTLSEPLFGGALATGSATALVGVPLLLFAVSRVRIPMIPTTSEPLGRRTVALRSTLMVLAVALLAALTLAILLGRDAAGWRLDLWKSLHTELPWRLSRTLAAAAAGALLAISGFLLQRVTGNPLASPDMLGLGAGASLGLLAALLLDVGAGGSTILTSSGAMATGGLTLVWALRDGFKPERLLVVGLSLGSCAEALIGAFAATGDPRATTLLAWAAGSTSRATPTLVASAALALALTVPAVALLRRPLDLLVLGPVQARALGLPVGRACFVVCLVSAATACAGTLVAGPFSFVGLIAPQVAGRLGLVRAASSATGAALIGAIVMSLGDTAGRVVDFPWQVPSGLMSALIGAPVVLLVFRDKHA